MPFDDLDFGDYEPDGSKWIDYADNAYPDAKEPKEMDLHCIEDASGSVHRAPRFRLGDVRLHAGDSRSRAAQLEQDI